ncbi:MAG TPA: hypothetical protein VGF24_17950 [Vicinamibacterales bacterium]|jgi:hypothetical protein
MQVKLVAALTLVVVATTVPLMAQREATPQTDLRLQSAALALINDPRPLTPAEVKGVLSAAFAAMRGKTFRVTFPAQATVAEKQIVPDERGRLRYYRTTYEDLEVIEDHTNLAAVTCDGRRLGGTLYIEYGRQGSGKWDVSAYPENDWHSMYRYFDIFDEPLESGGFSNIDEHLSRALVGPTENDRKIDPDFGAPPNVKHVLWLDVRTLLPVRWEMVVDGEPTEIALQFVHDPSLALRPPKGVKTPTCIN